jgi:fructose-1,6-bisphosphatase/inositol monophosphatase family enzyme
LIDCIKSRHIVEYIIVMEEYKNFAMRIAKEAGKIMKEHFVIGMARKEKEDTSPVTEADLKINSLIIREVSKLFPTHTVLGEEESNIIKDSEYVWICDPVDGTNPYSLGLPIATFSLALVKNGEVILGVIYDPFCDRLYSAEKGKGAYLNNKKIHVSDYSTLSKAKIEFEMFNRAKYDVQPLVNELKKYDVFLLKLASYANPSALVAAGEFTATIFPHTTVHDAAAPKIIVEEAGGKVTDIFGNEQRYDQPVNGLLVSNGIIHDQLVALAKQFVVRRDNI